MVEWVRRLTRSLADASAWSRCLQVATKSVRSPPRPPYPSARVPESAARAPECQSRVPERAGESQSSSRPYPNVPPYSVRRKDAVIRLHQLLRRISLVAVLLHSSSSSIKIRLGPRSQRLRVPSSLPLPPFPDNRQSALRNMNPARNATTCHQQVPYSVRR